MTTPLAPASRSALRSVATAVVVVVVAVLAAVGIGQGPAHADWIRSEQWHLSALQAPAAWRYATGAGVTVAVIDSGVDATHPDLAGQVLPGADFVDGSTDGRTDPVGHGTTVAALIAGRSDDGNGVAGIAPNVKILPIRVLDKENRYDDAAMVAKALRYAVDHGASVVNLSLGGSARSEVLAEALAYAADNDVVVVACTGNVAADAPTTEVWHPAREPGVVAVAGLAAKAGTSGVIRAPASGVVGRVGGAGEGLWKGSLTGPQTVLAAPAVNLIGARPGGYWRVQGTSFAAPLVTATAALIRSRWQTLDAANVVNRLILTARDLGPAGRDDEYGFGEVNPVGALTATLPTVARNPLQPPAGHQAPIDPSDDSADGGLGDVGTPAPVDAGQPQPTPAADIVATRRLEVSASLGAVVFALLLGTGAATIRRYRRSAACDS